jgi:hypothetical protein
MIGLPPKPREVWDSRRRRRSNPGKENIFYSIKLCSTYSNMNYPNVKIICNELNMD